MSHTYKQVQKPVAPTYSPVAAVKQYGDSWALYTQGISAHTMLALRDYTDDQNDGFKMTLMERGIIGRVW